MSSILSSVLLVGNTVAPLRIPLSSYHFLCRAFLLASADIPPSAHSIWAECTSPPSKFLPQRQWVQFRLFVRCLGDVIVAFIGCFRSISATFTYPCHILLRRSYACLLGGGYLLFLSSMDLANGFPGCHMIRSGDCDIMSRVRFTSGHF